MAIVVKETAKGELVESVLRVFSVEGVVVVVLSVAAPQLVWVHGVKVGGICRVSDFGDVGCHLLPLVAGEVNGLEERMSFDFISAILAKAVLRAAAQFYYEIRCLSAELGLWGNVQPALPVYYLVSTAEKTLKTMQYAQHFHCGCLSYLQLCLQGCSRQEGRLSHNHLIQDHTNTPPITELGVTWRRLETSIRLQ